MPLRIVIEGNQLSVGNRQKILKLDASKSPKEMDLTHQDGREAGQTTAAIYRLEVNRLTICQPYWSADLSDRPKEFKAGADDGLMLLVLERKMK